MTAAPQFVTFTGAEDSTCVDQMVRLSRDYPIEWGILFSASRQGTGRYPSLAFVDQLVGAGLPRLSAHLCGKHSRDLLAQNRTEVDRIVLEHFQRAQINTAEPMIDTTAIRDWGQRLAVTPILQCRAAFPMDTNVAWLFDCSGGRGIAPNAWPPAPRGITVGYAGGLNPDNVRTAVDAIGAESTSAYWLDAESGVRDEHDRFDLERCQRFCEVVFGEGRHV